MLDTFEKVAAHYAKIRPLVSKNHKKEDDLRPIFDRKRKWERIEKINENTYALWSGYTEGDNITSPYRPYSEKEKMQVAPILWYRNSKGVERIKIQNCTGGHATGYWNFIHEYLPTQLTFLSKGVNKYIRIQNGPEAGKEYLLQRRTRVTPTFELATGVRFAHLSSKNPDTGLTFIRQKDGVFRPDGTTKKMCVLVRLRVDKQAKAELKPVFDEYWEWFMSIQAMFPKKNVENMAMRNEYRRLLADRYAEMKGMRWHGKGWVKNPDVQRDMIAETDHPGRMYLALMLKTELFHPRDSRYDAQAKTWVHTPPDEKLVRSRYNRAMNTFFNIIKKEIINK